MTRVMSEKWLEHLRNIAGNSKGRKQTPEWIEKRMRRGENHPGWKGNEILYASLHDWVNKNLLHTETCGLCGEKKKLDAHNKTGVYTKDLENWEWLCRSCHMIKDGRTDKLHNNNIGRKHSEETKKKIGLALKKRGIIPPLVKRTTHLKDF